MLSYNGPFSAITNYDIIRGPNQKQSSLVDDFKHSLFVILTSLGFHYTNLFELP